MFPRSLGVETKDVSRLYIFVSHMCVIWVSVVGVICNCGAADYWKKHNSSHVFCGHLLDRLRHTVWTIMTVALQRVAVIRSCYNTDDLCRQKREKGGRLNYLETKRVLLKVAWLEMFSLLQYRVQINTMYFNPLRRKQVWTIFQYLVCTAQ